MKKKLFVLTILSMAVLASCGGNDPNPPTPKQYHFDVNCTNCLVNLENSLSKDVDENEFVTFKLSSNEGYLLPVDIKVTSGNEILLNNKDYLYSVSEDRLSGEISVKSTKAIDINIEANEQGYLFIGKHKITKSGDYSIYDYSHYGAEDASGSVLYDYKTNTLTLISTVITSDFIGTHEFDFADDLELFDIDKVGGLIGWTGGGSFTVKLLGRNQFNLAGENDLQSAFVAPLEDNELYLQGPGSIYFNNNNLSGILNQRGITYIDNLMISSESLEFSGIYSKGLYISDSNINLSGAGYDNISYGINSLRFAVDNSYLNVSFFNKGYQGMTVDLVDTKLCASDVETAVFCETFSAKGYEINKDYSTEILLSAAQTGIESGDPIVLNGCRVDCEVVEGIGLVTSDTTLEALNCSINVCVNGGGVAVQAYQIWFTDCDVVAVCHEGVGLYSGLDGDPQPGREFESNIKIVSSNVVASGKDVAIYGYGHFDSTDVSNVPNYLEKEVDEDHGTWIWAFCKEGETELKYNQIITEDGIFYEILNGLPYVELEAGRTEEAGDKGSITYTCESDKRAALGLGIDRKDNSTYYDANRTNFVDGVAFYRKQKSANNQVRLTFWTMFKRGYGSMKCTFTIAVVDKEGNEQGKFTVRKGCIGEGIQIIDFKAEDCVSGNELAIHLFLEDFENNKGQLYQVYVESLTIDYEIN